MKKLFLSLFFSAALTSAWSENFIKIDSVDYKSEFPQIKINITATDTFGKTINNISEENITVYEDGYRVNYVSLKSLESENETLYLVFSLDSSKSVSETEFVKFKKASIDIINSTTQNDKIALFRFNDEVILLNNFSSNKSELINNINKISRHGKKTLLFNAVFDSIDLLSKTESQKKRVIVYTDGIDEGSSVTSEDIIKFSNDTGIPVHFVCFKKSKNIQGIDRIAKLTGGNVFVTDKIENAPLIYSKLIKSLKSQYLIKYQSMIKKDGGSHSIEVRLKNDEIRDRAVINFTTEKEKDPIAVPELSEILLIIMTFLMLVMIIIFLIIMLKKRLSTAESVSKNSDYQITPMINSKKVQSADDNFEKITPYLETQLSQFDDVKNYTDEQYSKVWLSLKEGNGLGKKFPISWNEISLGKGQYNTIVIDDNAVSEKHCMIKKVNSDYILFDTVSENGTYLNGKKLIRPKKLFDWDEISMGHTSFIFRGSKMEY